MPQLLPTPGKQPQKLNQVCESRQVREAVSDRLMLGVPEFLGQGAPAIVLLCKSAQCLPQA